MALLERKTDMEIKEKHHMSYFWQALIICIVIFGLGVFLGYLMEAGRVSKIADLYQESEISFLNINVQDKILSSRNFDCNSYLEEITAFADNIYGEAKLLERYDDSAKFTPSLLAQHKKYDLLRAWLWSDLIQFKNKCPSNVSSIVYFYDYKSGSMEKEDLQRVFSKKLEMLKNEKGNSIILIPIAGNMNLSSVNLLIKNYGIKSFPAVIIDEKKIIYDATGLEILDSLLG